VGVNPRDHLPWPVVHGAAAVMFAAFGAAYAIVMFFPQIGAELAIPAWMLTLLFSLAGGLYYLVGAISGWLTDRYGARPVVRAGMVVLASGLAAASMARGPWSFALAYVMGVGIGVGLAYVPSSAAVQLHSGEHGALAGGIASSGIGVGTMLVPPACMLLIGWIGWRPAMGSLAALMLLGVLGSRPFRLTRAHGPLARRRSEDIASVRFMLLYLAYVCVGLTAFVPIADMVPYITSKGLPGQDAGSMLALIGSGSILGRFGFGYLADHVGARRASVQCAVLLSVSFVIMAVRTEAIPLFAAALLFGLSYGGMTGLTAATAAEVMGVAHFGGTLGTLMTSRAVGILFGPWCVVLGAEALGGYTVPYALCAALALAAAWMLHLERAPLPTQTL